MRALALVLAIAACDTGTMARHPFTTAAVANSALVIGAGICAIDCGPVASDLADGVLITELALSSIVAIGFVYWAAEEAARESR